MKTVGEWLWWLLLGFILVNVVMRAKPFSAAVTTVGSLVDRQAVNLTRAG
jgi:hypothetical protein